MFSPANSSVLAMANSRDGAFFYDIRHPNRQLHFIWPWSDLFNILRSSHFYWNVTVVFIHFRVPWKLRLSDSTVKEPICSAMKMSLNWSSTIFQHRPPLLQLERFTWWTQILVIDTSGAIPVALPVSVTRLSFLHRIITHWSFGHCRMMPLDKALMLTCR